MCYSCGSCGDVVHRTYQFKYFDSAGKSVTYEINPEVDTWSSFEGPMYNFFLFLKGAGFEFKEGAMIGVMLPDGKFIPADRE